MTLGKPQLSMFIVQVSQETELSNLYIFNGKMVLKRTFCGDNGEVII